MRIETLISPTVEPLTLAEAKTFCRVDSDLTDEDALISSLITAAREQIEVQTSRAFAVQTLRLTLDCFPSGRAIVLPRCPLIEVLSIEYDDGDGVEQTLSSSDYSVNAFTVPGAISPASSWPATVSRPGAVRITYQCGYTATDGEGEEDSEIIPERAKTAILYLVNHWYENRDAVVVGSIATALPFAVKNLISPLKIYYRTTE